MEDFIPVSVFCHAGHRGEEYPTAFVWENARLEVREIEKRWLEPGYRYFQVRSSGGKCFQLRCNEGDFYWEGRGCPPTI